MIYRKIMDNLEEQVSKKEISILVGSRQVGKTMSC